MNWITVEVDGGASLDDLQRRVFGRFVFPGVIAVEDDLHHMPYAHELIKVEGFLWLHRRTPSPVILPGGLVRYFLVILALLLIGRRG